MVLRGSGQRRLHVARRDREPEIGDQGVALAVDQHVGRLQIAVNDAVFMRGREAGTQLARDLNRFVLRHPADTSQQRRQIFAVHVLHGEESASLEFAQVVQATDVLVRNLARDAKLVVELGKTIGICRNVVGKELQGDRLIERQVIGAIHLSHAPSTEQRHQTIASGDRSTPVGARCPPEAWEDRTRQSGLRRTAGRR